MTGPDIVLIDANVLYSRTLRDWVALLQSSSAGQIFLGRWTEDIMAEVIYNLRRQHPQLSGGVMSDIRNKIEKTFGENARVTSFEIDADFPGTDPFDAHVHSAAVACQATILLTCDGGDFLPAGADPDELPYEIYTPDEFFVLVDQSAPEVVREVTEMQLKYWCSRKGEADLPRRLAEAGAPNFAEHVRQHLFQINSLPNPASLFSSSRATSEGAHLREDV